MIDASQTTFRTAVFLLLALPVAPAQAEWFSATVRAIAFGYSDKAAILLDCVSMNYNCPTYWGGYVCLGQGRASYEEEYALVLWTKAREIPIHINIDTTTRKHVASYINE